MLITPHRLINPQPSGSDGGIIIEDAGRAVANTYANRTSVVINPATECPRGNFWFRIRNDVSWSGTRCLFAAHPLAIDSGVFSVENRWVLFTVFKATPTSTTIFLTYTFTFEANSGFYVTGSTVFSVAQSEQWHMLNWWSDPIEYNNGAVLDGTLMGVDDDIQVGLLNDFFTGAHELNRSEEFLQGSNWFVNGAIADYAEVWVDKFPTTTSANWANEWRKFATSGGKPKNLGTDGSIPYGAAPQSYLRTWPGGTTLTNSGSAGNWSVAGTQFTLTSGPSQWGI